MKNKVSKNILILLAGLLSSLVICQCASSYVIPDEALDAFSKKRPDAAPVKSLSELLVKAQGGDAQAQVEAGKIYRGGAKGVPADFFKAYEWFKKAEQQGNADAMFQIGNMYYYGEIGPLELEYSGESWRNPPGYNATLDFYYNNYPNMVTPPKYIYTKHKKALSWYLKAAELNHSDAQNTVGRLLTTEFTEEFGQVVKPDGAEAIKWFRRAADNGNGHAMVNLFELYKFGWESIGNSTGNLFDSYRLGGFKGVGTWFLGGDNTILKRDDEEAKRWFNKILENGDPEALIELGKILYYRMEEKEEAMKLFKRAAEQNFAEAQYILGSAYAVGDVVKYDMTEAAKWLRKAGENGNSVLQLKVGNAFSTGFDSNKIYVWKFSLIDKEEAAKWFRTAAENGNAITQYDVGVKFHMGAGIQKDSAEAFKWFYKVATEGRSMITPVNHHPGSISNGKELPRYTWYLNACHILWYMYNEGLGVTQNKKEAEKWFVVDENTVSVKDFVIAFRNRDRELMNEWNARWKQINPQ